MKETILNFFVVLKCIDMVYFWVKLDEKSNPVAVQANLIPHACMTLIM